MLFIDWQYPIAGAYSTKDRSTRRKLQVPAGVSSHGWPGNVRSRSASMLAKLLAACKRLSGETPAEAAAAAVALTADGARDCAAAARPS